MLRHKADRHESGKMVSGGLATDALTVVLGVPVERISPAFTVRLPCRAMHCTLCHRAIVKVLVNMPLEVCECRPDFDCGGQPAHLCVCWHFLHLVHRWGWHLGLIRLVIRLIA